MRQLSSNVRREVGDGALATALGEHTKRLGLDRADLGNGVEQLRQCAIVSRYGARFLMSFTIEHMLPTIIFSSSKMRSVKPHWSTGIKSARDNREVVNCCTGTTSAVLFGSCKPASKMEAMEAISGLRTTFARSMSAA